MDVQLGRYYYRTQPQSAGTLNWMPWQWAV